MVVLSKFGFGGCALGVSVMILAAAGCKFENGGSDTLGRGTTLTSLQHKERCDAATKDLSDSLGRLAAAQQKSNQRSAFLKQCESEGMSKGHCLFQRLDRKLFDADKELESEVKKNKQAEDKKTAACQAAFKSAQSMSQTNPANVPATGCFVFRGTRTLTTSDGKSFKFGDGVSSVPIYIESIVQGPNDKGKHAVLRVWPKAGASKCKQVEVGFFATDLFFPTPAEQALCNVQCGDEPTAISTPAPGGVTAVAAASVGACFKTQERIFLYKDQFKANKIRPAGSEVAQSDYLVGEGQVYYSHRSAGNMIYVTVKTGSFRGHEGWMDRGEATGGRTPEKVTCPQ